MNQIIKNIQNNLHILIKFKFNKIQILFFSMIFFSLIYMLLDDTHFEGVNKFKELVKEEVIKDKVQAEIKENFNNTYENLDNYYKSNKILKDEFKEEVIDDAAKEIEKDVNKEELAPEKVDPPLYTKYLNRLYFAVITGCLLGYGDIYPVSNISKILAGIQGLLTVSLIIY